LHVWGCQTEISICNPQEKNLEVRTINEYFIGYLEKSKDYRFYCPNHSMRIVETENSRFPENGEISKSIVPRNVEIKEVGVQVHLTCASSSKVSVPRDVVPNNNEKEQDNNEPMI